MAAIRSALLAIVTLLAASQGLRAQSGDPDTSRIESDAPADTSLLDDAPLRESLVPFRFSGDARFMGQLADRPGLFQEVPDDYARFELTPTLSMYDVPFSAHVLLSTEQNERRQSINSIAFGLDFRQLQSSLMSRALQKVDELRTLREAQEIEGADRVRDSLTRLGEEGLREIERLERLTDYENLRKRAFSETTTALEQLGVMSATEKFFLNFPSLEFGVTYPRYTQLTLTSVPVNGANIEFNPGEFYVAFAGGSSQRSRTGEEILQRRLLSPLPEIPDTIIAPTYQRTMYAGRLGYGKKDATHFFVTTMWARDDDSEPPVDSAAADTLGMRFAPKSNFVFGLDAAVSIENDLVRLEGEINGSVVDGDITSPGFKNDDIPGFLVDLVDPTISSSVDYAYTVRTIIDVTDIGTKLTGSVRMIGPGYQSFGAPTLRNDLFRYDIRLDQRLLERQIAFNAFLRQDRDNLIDWKPATTDITAWGVGLALQFKRLPFLRLNFAPYHQSNDLGGERAVDNTTTTFSAITGYSFRTGPLTNATHLTYSLQQSETNVSSSDYGVGTLQFDYTAVFEFPLTLNAGIGLSQLSGLTSPSSGADSSSSIISFDFGGSFVAWDVWEASAGLSLASQADVDDRLGFFVGSSVALWEYGWLDVRAEKSTYQNPFLFEDRFEEFILRTTLTTRW